MTWQVEDDEMSGGGIGEAMTRDGSVHVTVSVGATVHYTVTLGPDVRDRPADELAESVRVVAQIAYKRVLAQMRLDVESRGGQSAGVATGWPNHVEVDALERELLGS